jgi:hypothetical protein
MQPKFLSAQRQEVGAKFSPIWKVGKDVDQYISGVLHHLVSE